MDDVRGGADDRVEMLELEQEDLLLDMVDAAKAVSRPQQTWHLGGEDTPNLMVGPWGEREVLVRDVDALHAEGLLDATHLNYLYGNDYVITQGGYFTAEAIRHERFPGLQSQEAAVRGFLDSDTFRALYPSAFARWTEAERLLRSAQTDRELTTIGHKARETMQEFATEMVVRYRPLGVDPNPALVNRRLGAVIAMYLPQLGEARTALLKALGNYSEAVMDVTQRQEHAGQKEGQALTWSDGRRVVFQVASVMYEYATTFAEIAPDV